MEEAISVPSILEERSHRTYKGFSCVEDIQIIFGE
jgi:hypothetical protein